MSNVKEDMNSGKAVIDLTRRLAESARKMRDLGLDMVEVEIISQLLHGKRTRNELTEEIFETRRGEDGYVASYTKIKRSLEKLQGRGYVSCPLFGKEKPYKLTRYAIERLTSVTSDLKPPKLIQRIDPVIYLACLVTGVATYHFAASANVNSSSVLALFPASFFTLLGFSLGRIWETLRKVF